MEIKVMSFNLRYNTPNDGENRWENRVDGVAQMIMEHDPLLVGTQEGYLVMLKDLGDRLPEYEWVGQGRMGGQENEHCAIFYKKAELEMLEQGQFWLSESPHVPASKSWDSNLPRICTWALFKHRCNGNQVLVYNTHLDHIGQEARNNGALMIWEHMQTRGAELAGIPVILLGDMNSHPYDRPIQLLRDHLKDAYSALQGDIGMSAHEFKGLVEGTPIDFIFVSQDVEVLNTEIDRRQWNGRYPSDHYPVVASLRTS